MNSRGRSLMLRGKSLKLRGRSHKLTALAAFILMAVLFAGMGNVNVSAANAMIQFGTGQSVVTAGAEFVVTMTVSASDNISAIDAYVSYDASVMSYVSGTEGVSGDSGLLHVSQSGIGGKNKSLQYSLKFKALGNGTGTIGISDEAVVKGESGKEISATSNRISVNVTGGASQTGGDAAPLSNDNNLLSLEVSNGTLEPEFSPDVTKYSLTVDYETEKLYFLYKTSDAMAAVAFSGNDTLYTGDNKVKVNVTAPNGDKKKYTINVKKETEQETRQRLIAEGLKNGSGMDFNVYNENGTVYIQNQYKFQIIDVDESDKVPTGYKKTSVLLYGVNITAYTMENDLDSDYLLMYCLNENGDKEFYQFDRQDKSLQRYTGSLIDKVNEGASNDTDAVSAATAKYEANLRQLAIIIAIISALCVLLVMGMISVIMRKSKSSGRGSREELDF